MQILNLLGFTAVNILDTQSVRSFTGGKIPSSTIRSSSFFKGSFRVTGTRRGGCITGLQLDQFRCDSFCPDILYLQTRQHIRGRCRKLYLLTCYHALWHPYHAYHLQEPVKTLAFGRFQHLEAVNHRQPLKLKYML